MEAGMVILTGAAPVVPNIPAPQDNRVAVCADLIAMVERAMVDPAKMAQQQKVLPHNRPAERPPGASVTSIASMAVFEASLVHFRGINQPFVVRETIDEIAALRRLAMGDSNGCQAFAAKDLLPASAKVAA